MKSKRPNLDKYEGIYWRDDSKYIWMKVNGRCESTKTMDPLLARQKRNDRSNEIFHGDYVNIRKKSVEDYLTEFKKWYIGEVVKRTYESNIGRIEIFLSYQNPKTLNEISYSMIADFLSNLRKKNKSPKTIKHYRQNIKYFIDEAIRRKYLKQNPIDKIKPIPVPFQHRFAWKPETVNLILDQAEGRLKLFLYLLAFTALRLGELLKLRWEQFDLEEGLLYRHGKHSKTKDDDIIPLPPELLKFLKNYPGRLKRGIIVLNQEGKPFYREGPKKAFKNLIKSINENEDLPDIELPKGTLFYAFRHSFAREYYRQTKDILALQSYLGHKRIETTHIYTKMDREHLKKQTKRFRYKKT
jgi:integrase